MIKCFDVALKSEVYLKFLCQISSRLILIQHEPGIEPIFWSDEPAMEFQPMAEKETVAVQAGRIRAWCPAPNQGRDASPEV